MYSYAIVWAFQRTGQRKCTYLFKVGPFQSCPAGLLIRPGGLNGKNVVFTFFLKTLEPVAIYFHFFHHFHVHAKA